MSLTAKEQAALQVHVQELRRIFGDRLERVILYGSKARGDDHPESDVDVLAALRDEVTRDDMRAAAYLGADGIMDRGVYVQTLLLSRHEFEHPPGMVAFIVADAEEEGVLLWT